MLVLYNNSKKRTVAFGKREKNKEVKSFEYPSQVQEVSCMYVENVSDKVCPPHADQTQVKDVSVVDG